MNILTRLVKETIEKIKRPGDYFIVDELHDSHCAVYGERYYCLNEKEYTRDIWAHQPNQQMISLYLNDGVITHTVIYCVGPTRTIEFHLADPKCIDKFEKYMRQVVAEFQPGKKPISNVEYKQIPVIYWRIPG